MQRLYKNCVKSSNPIERGFFYFNQFIANKIQTLVFQKLTFFKQDSINKLKLNENAFSENVMKCRHISSQPSSSKQFHFQPITPHGLHENSLCNLIKLTLISSSQVKSRYLYTMYKNNQKKFIQYTVSKQQSL